MSTPHRPRRRSRRRSAAAGSPTRAAGQVWAWRALVLAVIAIASWASAQPKVDHITAWVLDVVTWIPVEDSFLPFWLPAPMNVWGFRPLSVLLMKGAAALWGGQMPPPALIVGKTFLGLLALYGAAVFWLRAHGMGRVARVAALGTLMLSPTLFSCWYLTELDHLAAAALLAGLAVLRLGHGPGSLLLAGMGVGAAVLLKESSALLAFSFLTAGALLTEATGRRNLALRQASLLLCLAPPWILLTLSMVTGEATTQVGSAPWPARLPLLEHNAVQFAYLATPAGVAALGMGALSRLRGLPARLPPLAAVALLLLLPILTFYSHYETIYFATRWGGSLLVLVLMLALLSELSTARTQVGPATVAASILVGLAVFDLACLMASAPREDLAARLFLAAAPGLLGLAARAVDEAWSKARTAPARGGVALLALALAWGPLAQLANSVAEWQARLPVELAARQVLAAAPLEGTPVAFNNFQQWMGPLAQAWLGAPADVGTTYAPVPAWLAAPRLPGPAYVWTLGGDDLAGTRKKGRPVYLFLQANRARIPEAARPILMGDLSWIRRPLGALSSGRIMEQVPDVIADHSMIEDQHMSTWRSGPSPLQQLAQVEGEPLFAESRPYGLLPLNLLDLPRRLVFGVPWRVSMQAEVAVWRLPGASP